MSSLIDLDAYFRRIRYAGPAVPTLETLRTLHLLHPQAIAFENLDPLLGRPVSLAPCSLERKLVGGRRGGYCFEHNMLFREVLRALGFEVTSLLARTLWQQPADKVTARGHMTLHVTIDGQAYLADVGFGGQTLTGPLSLEPDRVQATPHGPFRLLTQGPGFVVQSRVGKRWESLYRFDLEAPSELDYEMANYYLSTHPASPFTNVLMVARPLGAVRYALHDNQLALHHPDGKTERRRLASAEELRRTLATTFALEPPDGPALAALLERLSANGTDGRPERPAAEF